MKLLKYKNWEKGKQKDFAVHFLKQILQPINLCPKDVIPLMSIHQYIYLCQSILNITNILKRYDTYDLTRFSKHHQVMYISQYNVKHLLNTKDNANCDAEAFAHLVSKISQNCLISNEINERVLIISLGNKVFFKSLTRLCLL